MIQIDHLSAQYTVSTPQGKKVKQALNDISLNIPTGQFIALLGANGSGKSTLAKHLNALLIPYQGTIWIDGKNTKDIEKLRQIRQEVGMVFQNPDNQIIGTNVEEDVAYGPENNQVPEDEIEEIVSNVLHLVGLDAVRSQSISQLSGGQKQRVAIADTLAQRPNIIVLDEPTAMLDTRARNEVVQIIEQLRNTNHTVILITHYTNEVLSADKIVLLNEGKIVQTGSPKEIFADIDLLQSLKLDIPQITALGEDLKTRGLPIETPVLSEQDLIDQLVTYSR